MARDLVIEIVGDTKSLERALGRADQKSKRFGSAMKLGLGGAAAALTGLGVAAKLGIDEFLDAQKVMAQTNAVLKSTGGAANVTADEITALSEALMKKSGVDDEAIQSGENMLLTFTKIRNEAGKGNDIFNQATKATLNLSVAMGKDMQSSAILVGKALNDPIKGMTALTKAGIQFTDEQKKTIKSLVESGDAMGAQKIILKELETQFGGSAEAAGKTFAGQMNIAKESALNFAGDIVAKTIPVLEDLVAFIKRNWPQIRAVIQDVTDDIRAIWKQWGDEIIAVVKFVFPIVIAGIRNFLRVIQGIVDVFTGILTGDWQQAWDGVKEIVGGALNQVKLILTSALTIWGTIARKLGAAIKDAVVEGVTGTATAVWNLLLNIGDLVTGGAGTIKGWGASVGNWVKQGVVDALVGIGTAAWNIINNIGSVIQDVRKQIVGWGADIARFLINGLLDGLEGLGRKIVDKIRDAFDWVRDHMPSLPSINVPFVGGDPRNPNMTMPPGTAVGGGGTLMGASPVMQPFAALGQSMGLHVTSGFRPGAVTANGTPSDHAIGKALDMADGPAAMARFFMALLGNPAVKQAFYDPLGSIFGGRWSSYREGGHSDHVHVATYDRGGVLKPGWTMAYNGTGMNEYVSRAAAGGGVVVNVYGDVSGEDLVQKVRDGINRTAVRNGSGITV